LQERYIFISGEAVSLQYQPRAEIRRAAESRNCQPLAFQLIDGLDLFLRQERVGKAAFDAGDGDHVAAGQIAADGYGAAAHGDLRLAGGERLHGGHAAFDQNDLDVEAVFFEKLGFFREPIGGQVRGERAVRGFKTNELGERTRRIDYAHEDGADEDDRSYTSNNHQQLSSSEFSSAETPPARG
jgi:hypothetical protein